MEEGTDGFGVGVDDTDAAGKVARVAFHVGGVFAVVGIFVLFREVGLQLCVMTSFWIQNETTRKMSIADHGVDQ